METNTPTNLHAIVCKYHGPTNTRGSRVSLYSERFKERISAPFDYSARDIIDQGRAMLARTGHNVVAVAETREGYILLSDTFAPLITNTK